MHIKNIAIGAVATGLLFPALAEAQRRAACGPGGSSVAAIVSVDGPVKVTTASGGVFGLALGEFVCAGDTISVGEAARLELRFTGKNTTVGLAQNSTLKIPVATGDQTAANATLVDGVLRFLSSVRGFFQVQTKETNAAIDGTEAVIATDEARGLTLVLVQEGEVTLSPQGAGKTLSLGAGGAGLVGADQVARAVSTNEVPAGFRSLVATPDGASDWAVNYPPILLATAGASAEAREAARVLDGGDPDAAEALLRGKSDAGALALHAVIAAFRNRPEDALDLSERAVAADPGLSAGHVAQSYAFQSFGDLSAARGAARRAVEAGPEDAFAWARRAELALLAGDRAVAEGSSARSLALKPNALAQSVTGLLALDAHDRTAARIAFDNAVALDSEAPLPRLGLGLLAIREGNPAHGRQEIETAAALDPRRASIRNWLGRAYSQEDRSEKALSQYDLAKAKDPDDPSPWLSAAETLFALNRPVEALREIEAARDRGGNRAVIRSERGLNEDRAVRGAAIGRTFEVLGFQTQAINESYRAAERDPASPVGHRLIADVLSAREGTEITRTSSLLRAQLLAPPNKAPIDPSLAESDLSLIDGTGVTRPSFADFSPFFESNGFAAQFVGGIGSQSTFTDTISFNALADGYSIGIAQFHLQTDGYRSRNDVRHDIVSLELKGEVVPGLTLFGELRFRDTDFEDRTLEFDLVADAPPGGEIDDDRRIARLGFHYEIDENQNLAGLVSLAERDRDLFALGPFPLLMQDQGTDDSARQFELQHIGSFGALTTQVGGSYYTFDSDLDGVLTAAPFLPFLPPTVTNIQASFDADHVTLYGYGTYRLANAGPFASAEITGGLSFDSFEFDSSLGGQLRRQRVNPKAGIRLAVTEDLIIRGAYTQTLTPNDLLNERIEPVTVAGFSQFFDQGGGEVAQQVAGAVDAKLMPNLWVGTEGAWRRFRTLSFGADDLTFQREIRGYANATFGDRWAGALDVTHQNFDSDSAPDLSNFETTEMRGTVSYFHPVGLFGSVSGGWVWHQFGDNFGFLNADSASDNFPILDLALGYRLPDQRGIVSLEIQNAIDESFGFEDRPLVSASDPSASPRFAREFTILGRIALSF